MQTDRLKISWIYLLSVLLNGPLFALYGLMPFILFKDLGATPLQIAALVSIKPLVAMLSSYWTPLLSGRLKKSILLASLIGAAPGVFFPWLNNVNLFVLAFGLYFLCERAIIPGWMEYLRKYASKSNLNQLVARGSLINFVLAAFTPFMVGPLMDAFPGSWRYLFLIGAWLSLCRFLIQSLLPIIESERPHRDMLFVFKKPWVEAYMLLKKRPDFHYYQWIFMFGGLGLMLMQPALPALIQDRLQLSYTQLGFAFALCKGLGFLAANPIWSSTLKAENVFIFCSVVTLTAALSIASLLAAQVNLIWLYVGFTLYGVMQAGSQLCWQLGGPLFSNETSSVPFTSVNVLLVGVRGLIGPVLGGILLQYSLQMPFISGISCCLIGSLIGLGGAFYSKRMSCKL